MNIYIIKFLVTVMYIHENACSNITVANQSHVDTVLLTQNDPHDKILKFGTCYAEHTVYLLYEGKRGFGNKV